MKEIYTLADLGNRDILDSASEKPARLAIIGYPIGQSKSPKMQQSALDAAGVDVRYIRIETLPEQFPNVVTRLMELNFIGVNVTVPHKHAASKLCNTLDPLATVSGSVNTIRFAPENATIHGFNTDGPGFTRAIREQFSVDLQDLNIVILGATGGAGVALAHTCAMAGCERLTLVGRAADKLSTLYQALLPHFSDDDHLVGSADRLSSCCFGSREMEYALEDAHLIVNASTVGMLVGDPCPIPPALISPHHLVCDIVTHKTALINEAIQRGARACDGRSMLLHQGAIAFEHWLGISPSLSIMRKALAL